jgi:hypothetical protein
VAGRAKEVGNLLFERVAGDPTEGIADTRKKVNDVVVDRGEPRLVALGDGLVGLTVKKCRSAAVIACHLRKTKSACTDMGFSHHSVPSLSNAAMRADGGTWLSPGEVTAPTNETIACLVSPSRQLGSRSEVALGWYHWLSFSDPSRPV